MQRLVAELKAAPSPSDVARALAKLHVRRSDGDAIVEAGGEASREDGAGARLEDLPDGAVGRVRFAPGAYASIPTARARVQLLEAALRGAREAVEVHVVVTDESSHVGRLVIDAPRRALRIAGRPTAEPGDRFGPAAYAHCFFDEEALLDEVARAGLVVTSRRGFTFVLRDRHHAAAAAEERAGSFAIEVARAVRMVRAVDKGRRRESPHRVLAAMRAHGSETNARGPIGRARLRRAIGWVDALAPGGASCYRRVLLEIALDAGAARETIVFGLDVGSTGHVAFEGREERIFDVSFRIPGG